VNVPGKRLGAALTAEKIYNPEGANGMSSLDIDSVAVSPDSTLIARGTASGIIRVWDVATGQNVAAFNVNGAASGDAAARPAKTPIFSPDGKTLVTADDADSTLAVWDVVSGHQVATLNTGRGAVASAAFTATGTMVAATTGKSATADGIGLWTTGKPLTSSSS
jgi:WD40 repeat protein